MKRFDFRGTPILINSRDRLSYLVKLIDWLLNADHYNIYVVDSASTYPPLLAYFEDIGKSVQVVRFTDNVGPQCVWERKLIQMLDIDTPFVVTDPDVLPTETCPYEFLEYYWEILCAFPEMTKVGPALVVSDLPDHYRWKKEVVTWETQFWTKPIHPGLYDAHIDTTFALYRPRSASDMRGIRTGFPYLARHLPWYEDSSRPTEEQLYYVRHAKTDGSSWCGEQLSSALQTNLQLLRQSQGRAA
jgi:hypothetical protein